MPRIWPILWSLLPIALLPAGAGAQVISSVSTDSLQFFLDKKDALNILKQANKLVNDAPGRAHFGYEEAFRIARDKGEASLAATVLRDEGLFFEELGLLDSASFFYEKSRLLSDSLGSREGQMSIYNDLAIVSRKLERYKVSKKYHLAALELARRTGNEEMVEFSWHGLGALYEAVGDSTQALYFYEQSKKAARDRGSTSGQLITLQNLARTYAGLRRQTEAEENIRQAIQLGENQPDTLEFANVLNIAGDVAEKFGQHERAGGFYHRAHRLYLGQHEFGEAIAVRMKLADIATAERRAGEAISIYKECLLRPEMMGPERLAEVELKLGKLYFEQKLRSEAEKMLLQSVRTCETNGLMEASVKSLHACHDLFDERKSYVKAYYFLKKAQSRTDSLAAFTAERANLALQFRYDQEQNEQSLERLRQRKNGLVLFGILFGILLMVGALGWLIYLRRRANAKLQLKNREIEEQNLRLRESNSFLQQFTYAVAHDLKEPLRTVGSFINILDTRFGAQFPEAAHEYMSFVTVGVRHMDLLIRDLLEYSKISSQRPGTDLVEPRPVMAEVIGRLGPVISEKKAEVSMATELPPVRFERGHLLILFQNLLSNGLKFNRSERPRIAFGGLRENGSVRYFIEDNGIGIDPEHGSKIFELFHKLHKNKGFDGTGIGLTVCKNIIDKYEGRIWFEPVGEGEGTRFWVEFPAG